jgi:hypothetical protein
VTESRLPAAIDYLVTTFTASTALQGLSMGIADGPIVSDDFRDYVFVGFDAAGTEGSDFRSASVVQKWASAIGQKKRDEDSQIVCSIVVTVGQAGWKPARDKAYAALEAIGVLLRADPSLGMASPSVAELWPGDLYQIPSENGWQAVLQFVVRHNTRV